MNTFKIFQVAAISLLMSSPAFAATDDQSQSTSNMPMMQQNHDGMMMQPGMTPATMTPEHYQNMPMMNPQMMGKQMMKMRDQMQENHALMDKIMAEEDATKRNKMMQQHMKSMQQQMQGMNKMMDDELMSGMPSADMDKRMEMMNMRMNMMQMMMEQMMGYQDQAE